MVASATHRLAFLTVVLAGFFLSGCTFFGVPEDPIEILREHVRDTVEDPDRVQDMLASVDHLDQLLVETAQFLVEAVQQERVLFRDYDSTQQEYEAFFFEASRERENLRDQLLDAHLEFKAMATAEEWQELLPVHARAISLRMESLVADAIGGQG
jgi:hypothetical protein